MNNLRKWNEVLRRERELRGWSQAELAEEVGTDQKVVSRWERGISHPSPYFRKKLIELLGKNAAELGFVVQPETPELSLAYDRITPASSLTQNQTNAQYSPISDHGSIMPFPLIRILRIPMHYSKILSGVPTNGQCSLSGSRKARNLFWCLLLLEAWGNLRLPGPGCNRM